MQGGTPIPDEEVRQALAHALEGLHPADAPNRAARASRWLSEHLSDSSLALFGKALVVLLVLGVVVALVKLALRQVGQRRPSWGDPEAPSEAELEPAERARALARAARAARDGGDLRLALRLFLQAVLVALGGRGDLELRPAWTNRELLRRGNPSSAARALLAPLVRELEPMEFGHAPVGAADVRRLEALLDEHLEAAP